MLVVFDRPTRDESARDDPFSSASNMNFFTSLRIGRANVFNRLPVPGWMGIFMKDITPTYVDYSYTDNAYGSNKDYPEEVSKDALPGYVAFRNVYLSARLHDEVMQLYSFVEAVEPEIVIITGKWGLFFLTEGVSLRDTRGLKSEYKPLGGLARYRGSILYKDSRIYFPMYHTLNAVIMTGETPVIEMDLQKVGEIFHNTAKHGIDHYKVSHTYHIGDDGIDYAMRLLRRLDAGEKLDLAIDIETMFYSVPGEAIIDCIGIAHSVEEGGCIALAKPGVASLHSLAREQEIMEVLFRVLTHSNATLVGQNAVAFDIMVILGRYLFLPIIEDDSLIMQHTLYSFLPKDLAFLASMYCKSVSYWKDEIGDSRWIYNVKDAIYTLECVYALRKQFTEEDSTLAALYKMTMDDLVPATLRTMRRGVRVDLQQKAELYKQFTAIADAVKVAIYDSIGFEFNLNSGKQKKKIFTDFLGMTLNVAKRKGKDDSETLDSKAMLDYMDKYPLYKPFLALLLEYTAIVKFTSAFLGAATDPDGRMRTQYKVAGTATGRLASSKNAFGRAANMQNIPKKGKLELRYATEVEGENDNDSEFLTYSPEGNLLLPNVKKMFIPDDGYELMDADLSGADARVVAWEAECRFLIDFFEKGIGKLYAYIASEHLQREITEKSAEYKLYKSICHGCVTGEHEVLTRDGWKRIDMYNPLTEDLMVWEPESKHTWFEKPIDFYIGDVDPSEDLYSIEGDSLSFLGTQNHGLPYLTVMGEMRHTNVTNLTGSAKIPCWGVVKDDSFTIIGQHNIYSCMDDNTCKFIKHNGTTVYCPTTSTGYFMIRRNGKIYCSKNSNYGLGLEKMAVTLAMPMADAKRLQSWYFLRCPEIPRWHKRLQDSIAKRGYIDNIFGRRRYFIDKSDVTRYNKAYGFIGQSTVADAMNIAWPRVEKIPDVQVLMQVHDSIVTQYPIEVAEDRRSRIISAMEVVVPYKHPLIIPVDYKTSTVSYGHV